MATEISSLFASFEDCRFDHRGVEAWRARDLMSRLGYGRWENFREAIRRAWQACEAAGIDPYSNFIAGDGAPWVPDQVFRDSTKNPEGGRPSEDVILTRRAAYLVAMNGDTKKPQVAFAQHYFATSTRTLEILQKRLGEADRLTARGELTETENKFSGVLFEAGLDNIAVARVRSRGDQALFGGKDTRTMKKKWGVPESRPLADFAPEVAIRAKQLSAAITSHNVKTNNIKGERDVGMEHVTNNTVIRETVVSRGIVLEEMAGEEDIKKVERRHASEAKKVCAPEKLSKPGKAAGVAGSPAKKPTAKSMVQWFSENHATAVNCSPFVDGEYTHPVVDIEDVLSRQFPDASTRVLEKAASELDEDGPWVSGAFLDMLEAEALADSREE